jgi:tetratricopeptide (TPR) repeat protein
MKRILASVLAMIALGSGLAYAVIWVLNSYEQYKMTANRLRVEWLIKEGVAAYNAQDYAGAIDYFEQARASLPDRNTRATIAHNLTAAYVQRARQAQANGRMEEARSYYEKALNISPNSRLAHQGLAETLERLDQREAAQSHREAAQSSLEDQVPASLWVETIPGSGVRAEAERQQPIVNRQREAAQLIQEGKALYQQGNRKAARQNWLRAIELAPGTPERDEAKQLLEQSGG